MEVRERGRLEKLIPEIEADIDHIRANIARLKAKKHEKNKLIEKIKEMLR
jgi:prefoldin subunit 5